MHNACHGDASANTGNFQGQEVPSEDHHMDGMLLEEPSQPPGVPSAPPLAECPKAAGAAPCLDIPSICQGVGCSRQAKFGYEGASRTACAQHRLGAMVLRTKKGCETPDCHRAAFYGFDLKEKATACGVHKIRGMVDLKHKRCEVVDCVRHRVYGAPGGKAMFCSHHKEPGMCNVVSRRCSIEGCFKIPTHISQEDKRYRVCTSHKVDGMINVSTNRSCEAPGCSRNPIFGFEGQRNNRCAAHKEEGMVDVKHARCVHQDCSKVAAYALEGEKPRFCYGHKEAGMLSKKHRRCARSPCTRQPVFGFVGGKATLCSGHKVDGMQNVFDKSCSAPACRKVPTFGPEDGKATACASHKTLGMVNVRNPRCEMQGCSKQPRFGTLGDKPRVCLDHTQNGMTELRPVHQGRTKKLRTFDAGTFPGATSPASLPPGLPHTGQLAGVTGQPAVPHLAFLPPSISLTTRTSILQGVEFDRVAPQAVGREGIMPQAFMPGGFSSQGFASADFSAQNVVPQGATTEEMPQAPTPGESGTEGAAGDSGMPVSDALQAVEPNSTGLQSMAMSPAMVTEQPASTHPVGLESETTVSARSAGQSVSTHSSGLPSEAMPPVFTTTGSPLPPNPTDLHSTDVSPATTTGEPDSTNSTGLQSESTMRMASTTGQLVSTNATGLQPETMAPEMTIRQPISTSSTTLHSTEMPPAMATGQPDATHSTGLQPEAVVIAGSTGVVDMPMGPPGGVPNAAPPNMQPAVYRSQACQKHKQSGMTYGFGSKCRFGGCVEQPQYGFDDEGPRFCGCHKRDGMSDRTTASNCEVEHSEGRAMDGLDSPSQGQSYVHQAAAMMGSDAVKMHHKFCVWESCLQPPLYSWSGEDSPRFCETHASPGMVPPSTGGHPCRYHGCLKQACFAFEGEACRFCQEHCLDGMLEAEGRQCYHQGCTGLAPYSSDLSPVKDGYPSLPPSSGSISLLADDAASHDMPSQMSHHFSGDRDGHHGMVDDAIGASNNVDEIGYLRSGSGGGGSPPLGNEDATSVHAEDGGQSALLPPSPRRDVGVDMAPHSDEAREHHPSPFQPQH